MNIIPDALRRIAGREHARRTMSHGDLISHLCREHRAGFAEPPVFVETGSGVSTVALAQAAGEAGGIVYSCDCNDEKVSDLKQAAGPDVGAIRFRIGDSLDSLREIVREHGRLDFVFLDSAASAMHTFREFTILEQCLERGAVLLVDNAALPNDGPLLSPVRKGRILVHYLLASAYWEVQGHPTAGDSMVSAVMRAEPDHADPAYEHPDFVDHWRGLFERELGAAGSRCSTRHEPKRLGWSC